MLKRARRLQVREKVNNGREEVIRRWVNRRLL